VESTVQTLRPTADAKTVCLSVESSSAGSLVNGDGRRLQQVLWNLVHNALKFTPRGGQVNVAVRTSEAEGAVRLVVADTGCGISPAFLPHVFERFRQEDPSSTRQSPGLGLGLSIARHLAELHGGTIRASSAGPGHGATFVLELPRALPSASTAVPLAAARDMGG
jgi:signal transduction histidine kinase